jgi:hypothetical protein
VDQLQVETHELHSTDTTFSVIPTGFVINCQGYPFLEPIPVAVRSKAWVCGRSLTRIVGSNLTGGMDVCLL